jgi:outer membrane lipoprotein-sorting protein
MKSAMRSTAAAALLAALLLPGCSTLSVRKPNPQADALVNRLAHTNQTLMDFKGIGTLKLTRAGQVQSSRLAFAGSIPARLRLDVMGSPGQHLASLASDGKWFYILLYQEKRFHRQRISDSSFEHLVSLPVTVVDVLDLLAGRVPIRSYRTADLMDNRKDDGYVLELRNQWGQPRQRIFVDAGQVTVKGYEVFHDNGSLAYRVELVESQIVDGHQVPKWMVIADDKEERLDLKVEQYWANAAIAPSGFVLKSPD